MLTKKRPAPAAIVHSATMPHAKRSEASDRATARLLSSKHLDLMLLACCSCLLTLMCHPVVNLLPGSSAANSITVAASQAATSSQTNFYVKSALMSAYQDKRKGEASADS